ncbi:MAG: GTPase HflX [Marinilabiliales bacterium]|nr:MAG: GTPase HflX [Marinilabiliales bacterium]
MIENVTTEVKEQKAVLIGVINQHQTNAEVEEYLNELAFLAETAGAVPVERFFQRVETPNPGTYIGSGKLSEIQNFVKQHKVDMAIFDDELSASQFRNIEKILGCRVIDRTNLILDIFARRAKTAHARTQVELAQYQYLLPRLAGLWTHLERQRGGIGLRGPGETEIETDRRIVRDKIAKLQERLEKIDKQKATQRKNRGKLVRVSLVGYTNVGKSTIMNLLSKSDVFAEDKLFATLDTTVRKVVIGNLPFLLSDTVGFIRKLPHQLVESFKSTLDEVRESDILLHVVDISHPGFEEQINIVNQTLHEMNVNDKPVYLVFNKIDRYNHIARDEDDLTPPARENISLDELKLTWMARNNDPCIFISAKDKVNIDGFRELIYGKVRELHEKRYPYNDFLYPG